MDKERIAGLFAKYIESKCTEDELRLLMRELNIDTDGEAYHAVLDKYWNETEQEPEISRELSEFLFRKITDRTNTGSKKSGLIFSLFGRQSVVWKIAACFAGLLFLAGIVYKVYINDYKEYTTGYGETASIVLPDSSTVILNGNSTVRYSDSWNDASEREVWLQGQGYFEVRHTKSHAKFLVHTSNEFTVEVLGTKFTVNNRNGTSRVVLTEGHIRLNIKRDTTDVVPGEFVEYREDLPGIVKKTVNPEVYSAWINRKMIFDRTSIGEIIAFIKDTYGLEIEVAEPQMLQYKIDGSLPLNGDTETLLQGIAELFEFRIEHKGDRIKFVPGR